jgi:hypothetical protein
MEFSPVMVTSSPPAALMVNPAFLQEIKDSNPDLSITLGDFRQLLHCGEFPGAETSRGEATSQTCRRLTRLLDDLREHLALQFSLEESYGYLLVPNPSRTVLSQQTRRVQSQHQTLYLQLSDLAEQAEELQYRGVELSELEILLHRSRQFDANLREHEAAESELIERCFDLS